MSLQKIGRFILNENIFDLDNRGRLHFYNLKSRYDRFLKKHDSDTICILTLRLKFMPTDFAQRLIKSALVSRNNWSKHLESTFVEHGSYVDWQISLPT